MSHVVSNLPFVPTAPDIVDAMLERARVTSDDVLFDLGSGDGHIAITVAVRYGTPATGVELNAELIRQSTAAAAEMGVPDRTSFFTKICWPFRSRPRLS